MNANQQNEQINPLQLLDVLDQASAAAPLNRATTFQVVQASQMLKAWIQKVQAQTAPAKPQQQESNPPE